MIIRIKEISFFFYFVRSKIRFMLIYQFMIPPLEESKQYLCLFYFQEKFPNVLKKMNYHAQDLCEKGDSFGFDKRYCLY